MLRPAFLYPNGERKHESWELLVGKSELSIIKGIKTLTTVSGLGSIATDFFRDIRMKSGEPKSRSTHALTSPSILQVGV
jgi:hypothetical protein